jgi:hypothetical protein
MEPPEKRNANSNDHPAPCQGHFPINFISTRMTTYVVIFHLVIVYRAYCPERIAPDVDPYQGSGNRGLFSGANWLIITHSGELSRLH